jgi:hypothetical protein
LPPLLSGTSLASCSYQWRDSYISTQHDTRHICLSTYLSAKRFSLSLTYSFSHTHFLQIVSLLGSFTVTILSFVLPPALHLILVVTPQLEELNRYRHQRSGRVIAGVSDNGVMYRGISSGNEDDDDESHRITGILAVIFGDSVSWLHLQYVGDAALTAMGCIMCILATSLTATEASEKYAQSGQC